MSYEEEVTCVSYEEEVTYHLIRSASRKSTDVSEFVRVRDDWETQETCHAKRSEGMRPTRRIETDCFYHHGSGADGPAEYNRPQMVSPSPQKEGRQVRGSTLQTGARFLFCHHGHYCNSAR